MILARSRPVVFLSWFARVAGLSIALAGPLHAAAIDVAITPATQNVALGAVFTVSLTVTGAGPAFNGFDAVLEYDPAALTCEPTSPTSLQQGALMTGACGSTFHYFTGAADSLRISDVLLCSGVSVTGPGVIYQLQFRASETPQATQIVLRRAVFYDAGVQLEPPVTHDAMIGIGIALAADPLAPGRGLSLGVRPNPSRGPVQLMIGSPDGAPLQLEILDLAGRRLRRFDIVGGPSRSVTWDGRDASGRRLPPGRYRARLVCDGQAVDRSVTLLR